jgi:quinolinate synthase
MIKYVKNSEMKAFIIATEIGVVHRLKKENPGRNFIPASGYAVCPNMKMHTLGKMVNALKMEQPEILLPSKVIEKARAPVEKMLRISAELKTRQEEYLHK